MTSYYDKDGKHEALSQEELVERLRLLREAEARNTRALEAEYRGNNLTNADNKSWVRMVAEEDGAIEGLGSRDDSHHAERAKKQRKKKEKG